MNDDVLSQIHVAPSMVRRELRKLYGPLVVVRQRDGVWQIGLRQGDVWSLLAESPTLQACVDGAMDRANKALGVTFKAP